jgi:hypothetical protein
VEAAEQVGRTGRAFAQARLREALRELSAGRFWLSAEDTKALTLLALGQTVPSSLGLPEETTEDELGRVVARETERWRRVQNETTSLPLIRHAQTAEELCQGFHPDLHRSARAQDRTWRRG